MLLQISQGFIELNQPSNNQANGTVSWFPVLSFLVQFSLLLQVETPHGTVRQNTEKTGKNSKYKNLLRAVNF